MNNDKSFKKKVGSGEIFGKLQQAFKEIGFLKVLIYGSHLKKYIFI